VLKGFHVLAFADEAGLGAEFHFVRDSPAVARQMAGKTGVETSLYMARVMRRTACSATAWSA